MPGPAERYPIHGRTVWWDAAPAIPDPAGVDRGVSLWLARKTGAATVYGTVKGASVMSRRFVRRVIGERKLFGYMWSSYRVDEEDPVTQAVEILHFDDTRHGWKAFMGGHEDWIAFTEVKGLAVDRLTNGAPVFAIRITQGDSKLPGFMCRGQLIIPLHQHKQPVTVRELLV